MSPFNPGFNDPFIAGFWGVVSIVIAFGLIAWTHFFRRHHELIPMRADVALRVGIFVYTSLAIVLMSVGVILIAGVFSDFHLDMIIAIICVFASALMTVRLVALNTQRSVSEFKTDHQFEPAEPGWKRCKVCRITVGEQQDLRTVLPCKQREPLIIGKIPE